MLASLHSVLGHIPAALAEQCLTPHREELNQPIFAAIDAFEFPELHDESIAARNFFRHLSKLMAACGVKDFGMKVGHNQQQMQQQQQLSVSHPTHLVGHCAYMHIP